MLSSCSPRRLIVGVHYGLYLVLFHGTLSRKEHNLEAWTEHATGRTEEVTKGIIRDVILSFDIKAQSLDARTPESRLLEIWVKVL